MGVIVFSFRDYFSSFIPSSHKEDELFKTYVQELYDKADIYIQGFPTYYLEHNGYSEWVPGMLHLKYSIADFDGDRQNELVIYSVHSESIDWFYGPSLPNDSEIRGQLYYYEIEDNKVKETHHTDYGMGGRCLDDIVFYNSGIGMYDGENPQMADDHTWNIYDINGKNFSEEDRKYYEGVYLMYREIDSKTMQRDVASLQSQMEYKEISKKEFENEWEEYISSGKEISIDFNRFDTLNNTVNEEEEKRRDIKIDEITGKTWSYEDEDNNEYRICLEPSAADYKGKGSLLFYRFKDKSDGVTYRELERIENGEWHIVNDTIRLDVSLSGDGKSLHSYQLEYSIDNDFPELLFNDNGEKKSFKISNNNTPVDNYEESIDFAKNFAKSCGYNIEKEVPGFLCKILGEDWYIVKGYSTSNVAAGMGKELDKYTVFTWRIDRDGTITAIE